MHRVKVETAEEDFIMNQQCKLKEAALASGLSPTKEVSDIAALKQELGGAACSSAVHRRCSERLKNKPLKRYDIYFNARPRKKMKRLEEIDEILSSTSKTDSLKKRKSSSETDNGHSNVKDTRSSRTEESPKRASARFGNSNQKNATKRRSPLASKQKYFATVSLSKRYAAKQANSRKSAVDEKKNCPIQNLRKKRISVGSYEQNCAEKLREVDDTDGDWSIRSWQNKSMHVGRDHSMLSSRIEQQTDTDFGVDLNIALKVTKPERQEDIFSVVDSLKMFSSCLRSCMTDEIEKQVEADGLCTEGEECEGQQRQCRSQSRLVEGWLSDWEREDIDESRNASSNTTSVDIATHYTCTLNKEWSFKDHEETEQKMCQEGLKDKECRTSLPEHLNGMEDVITPAIAERITDVIVAQPEALAVQPIDAESSSSAITPLKALTGCHKNSASEGPASAGTHEQQAVNGGSLNSEAPAFQHIGPAEEQSGIQRLHVEVVVETPSEQASQDGQHNENFPSLCTQTEGLVLPTVKSEPATSDNLKGILKRGLRLCEHACDCIECVSGRSRAERASKFSQQQMRDIEGVSVMLLKELRNTRALIKSKLLADSNVEELEEVRAVTSQALRTEEKAKSWIVRMARDCNRYCRIMESKAEAKSQRKIVFADEAGKQLSHIKLFNTKE